MLPTWSGAQGRPPAWLLTHPESVMILVLVKAPDEAAISCRYARVSGLEDATEQEDVSRQVPASSVEVTPALGTSGALVKPGWSLSPQTLPPPLPPCAFPLSRHVCLKGLPFPFHLPNAVLRGWLMRSRGSRRWSRPRWAAAPPSPLPSRRRARGGPAAFPLSSRSAFHGFVKFSFLQR